MNEYVKHKLLGALMLFLCIPLIILHEYGCALAGAFFALAALMAKREVFEEEGQ